MGTMTGLGTLIFIFRKIMTFLIFSSAWIWLLPGCSCLTGAKSGVGIMLPTKSSSRSSSTMMKTLPRQSPSWGYLV